VVDRKEHTANSDHMEYHDNEEEEKGVMVIMVEDDCPRICLDLLIANFVDDHEDFDGNSAVIADILIEVASLKDEGEAIMVAKGVMPHDVTVMVVDKMVVDKKVVDKMVVDVVTMEVGHMVDKTDDNHHDG